MYLKTAEEITGVKDCSSFVIRTGIQYTESMDKLARKKKRLIVLESVTNKTSIVLDKMCEIENTFIILNEWSTFKKSETKFPCFMKSKSNGIEVYFSSEGKGVVTNTINSVNDCYVLGAESHDWNMKNFYELSDSRGETLETPNFEDLYIRENSKFKITSKLSSIYLDKKNRQRVYFIDGMEYDSLEDFYKNWTKKVEV